MPNNRVPLHKLFLNLQRQMATELTTARDCIPHQGAKGDATEDCWLKMLNNHLPMRYRAEKAFIIDCDDKCSDQIDIVIFDQFYSPFLFRQNSSYYVPAESVYAVIEAKQEINKGLLEYAANKAASVRRLRRTNAPFRWLKGTERRQDAFQIAAGIVALSAEWKPPFGMPFTKAITALSKDPNKRIDFGCAIDPAAFDIEYRADGTPAVTLSGKETGLMWFFMCLLSRLQRMGTVPAIEISEYLRAL